MNLRAGLFFLADARAAFGRRLSPRHRRYRKWIALHDTLSDRDRRDIAAHIARLDYRPLISIVMPAYETPAPVLGAAIASVRAQLYDNWELCVVDDASPSPRVTAILQEAAAGDARIKWLRRDVNGHVSAASNSALSLANGDFIALMDHDDLLAEQALYEVVVELNAHPGADIVYSDEDRVDDNGLRHDPYFKTDWNLELFLGQNMINHFCVFRRSLVTAAGGFRLGFEGSQDYDLALRIVARTTAEKIRHVPAVLYHWRRGSHVVASLSDRHRDKCIAAARRAKTDFSRSRGGKLEIAANPLASIWERVRRPLAAPAPLVSLIVVARDAPGAARCVGQLLASDYPSIEVIVVAPDGDARDAAQPHRDGRVHVVAFGPGAAFATAFDSAFARAAGAVVGFIDAAIETIEPNVVAEMASLALDPDHGAIGAKLLGPDGRIVHGGFILGAGGGLASVQSRRRADRWGYFGRLVLATHVSAVSGVCLFVRKSLVVEAGGVHVGDPRESFGYVDLCLRIGALGLANVWTPFAELRIGAPPTPTADDIGRLRAAWPGALDNDPFYNPNLALDGELYDPAFPPRRRKPWRQ